ncbi:IS1182 family transposase [Nonomuraea sp. NPDC001699]
MSLRRVESELIPSATAEVARAAFPKGSLAIRIRDELGVLFADEDFAEAFSTRGQPALSPARLALVSILQFTENLSGRKAAEAARARIDWKYALGLELTDPGFDHSVLCEFRLRLIDNGMEQRVFDAVLERAREAGLVRSGGRQRTDSTHVLAAIRSMNRLEKVHETLRAALNALAVVAPDWLVTVAQPEWWDRYDARTEEFRMPKQTAAKVELANQIGVDGIRLLLAVYSELAPPWLREVPAVEMLRRIWIQEFRDEDGQVRWRTSQEQPASSARLISPYDEDARVGVKRDTQWDGFKVYLTETCDDGAPHVITHVTTTPAPGNDFGVLSLVHKGLAERRLLPVEHLVDTGYMSAAMVVAAKPDHNVEMIGPMMPSTAWQKSAEGTIPVSAFTIDWDNEKITCPQGKISKRWAYELDESGTEIIRVQFARKDCTPCPVRPQCTRASIPRRRITLRTREQYEVLQQARINKDSPEWRARYQARQGIEGTIAQAVNGFRARGSRYRGTAKTHLQHLLTAAAMNLTRIDAWLMGVPLAPTRTSHFAALAA